MTIDQAIAKMLYDSTDVTDIVGTRIFFGKTPETVKEYPKINYFLVSDPNIFDNNINRQTWQISCRAETPQIARSLSEIIKALFKNFQGTVDTFDIQAITFLSSTMIKEPEDIYNFPVDIGITFY